MEENVELTLVCFNLKKQAKMRARKPFNFVQIDIVMVRNRSFSIIKRTTPITMLVFGEPSA